MNESKLQKEPTGLERFGQLEDKISRIVEEYRTVRKDNDALRSENQKLKEEIGTLHGQTSAARDNLQQFQKEREELRERVEKALTLIASLEAR
jgi:uncharacterized coiled-coil DUF342 family protein